MRRRREENPFIFGEIGTGAAFVDRADELQQVVRDVTDGRKLFLLSPRRFWEELAGCGGIRANERGGRIVSATNGVVDLICDGMLVSIWCLFL